MKTEENLLPLSESEITSINFLAKSFRVMPLICYPTNGVHYGVFFEQEIPFAITRNADPFVIRYNDREEGILRSSNKWVVAAKPGYSKFFKYNKEFEDVFDAVEYAIQVYMNDMEDKVEALKRWKEAVKRKRKNQGSNWKK